MMLIFRIVELTPGIEAALPEFYSLAADDKAWSRFSEKYYCH